MTCSIPLPRRCSSTRIISRPALLWLPQRLSIHPPFQRPDRNHIPSVGDEPRRIIWLSSPVPRPRLSPLSPTTGLPDSLVLILAVPNPSLRMRVPEIAMRPSEDCPNARSNLKTDLALLPTSYQMRRPPVRPFSFILSISVSLILLSPSPPEVLSQTTKAGTLRMATLLHRFYSEGSGQHHQEAQRRPGCQGGRSRIRKPQRRRERGLFLI